MCLQIDRHAREVERKKVHFVPYNILPLHVSEGPPPAIMELPEVCNVLIFLLSATIFLSFFSNILCHCPLLSSGYYRLKQQSVNYASQNIFQCM